MPLTTASIDSLLDLFFLNSNWPNVGDATGLRGSSAAGSFYLSLHTAAPGVGGSQNTSEISYTGYARVAMARTSGGWTRTGDNISPTATVSWPACTGGAGGTVTHVGIGTDSGGAGHLLMYGTITPNIAVSNGVTPQATTASTVTFT